MSYDNLLNYFSTNASIDEIVEKNIPLVHSLTKRYLNRGAEYDDLFQVGSIGLYKAAVRFNPDLGFKFSTYAASLITGEIRRYLRDDGIIKVSRRLKEVYLKTTLCIKQFTDTYGRTPTLSETAALCSEPVELISQALDSAAPSKSIYEKISDGKTIAETLPDTANSNEKLINNMLLKNIINKFPLREKKIIIYRYYFDKTQKEVAALLTLSQVQISRIEKRIIEKMRNEFNK